MNVEYVRIAKKLNKKLLKELKGRIIIKHIKNKACIVCIGNGPKGRVHSYNIGWSLVHKKLDHYSRRIALFQAICRAFQNESIGTIPPSLLKAAAKVAGRAERYFKLTNEKFLLSVELEKIDQIAKKVIG